MEEQLFELEDMCDDNILSDDDFFVDPNVPFDDNTNDDDFNEQEMEAFVNSGELLAMYYEFAHYLHEIEIIIECYCKPLIKHFIAEIQFIENRQIDSEMNQNYLNFNIDLLLNDFKNLPSAKKTEFTDQEVEELLNK